MIAILALSFLILVHELGHLLAAKRFGVKVEEFGLGYPPRLLVVARLGGTLYSINAIPFGGFVRLAGEDDPSIPHGFAAQSKRVRTAVLLAGSAMNLLFALLLFSSSFALGTPEVVKYDHVLVMEVAPNSPADRAGVQEGDIIFQVDEQETRTPEELKAYVDGRLGQEVVLHIKREEEVLLLRLTPRPNPPPNEGAMGVRIAQAVAETRIKRYPLPLAFWLGSLETTRVVLTTLLIPVILLRGLMPLEMARPIGPASLVRLAEDAARQVVTTGWWFPILQIMGFFNAALAVTNLFPLPAVDGGRLMFIAIEAIRGKRVDPKKEGLVHFIGMAVLLFLMVLITFYDLISPVRLIKWEHLLGP